MGETLLVRSEFGLHGHEFGCGNLGLGRPRFGEVIWVMDNFGQKVDVADHEMTDL